MNPNVYRRRQLTNRIGLTLSMLAMALGLSVLLAILLVLFKNGFAALDWAMFTESTPAPGSEGGGLANAIVGTLLLTWWLVAAATSPEAYAEVRQITGSYAGRLDRKSVV